jgi:hypothetical protein
MTFITGSGWAMIGMAIALGILSAVAIYHFLVARDTRRDKAYHTAQALRAIGLVVIPKILEAYARGGYKALEQQLHQQAEVLLDSKQAVAEFKDCAFHVVKTLLSNPDSRASTVDQLNKLMAASATSATATAVAA